MTLSPEQWQEVKRLLNECLDLPTEDREQYLSRESAAAPELRAEVRSLLQAADQKQVPKTDEVRHWARDLGELGPGSRLGPYRLVEEIGHGGMGTVYLAVRDDGLFAQQVAIKVVKRGMDNAFVIDRFRREQQILAFLNHSNICALLDGGCADDGRPYFVMEYIEGSPITKYCRENALSLEARLRIFLEVCAAVEHAHQRLVVHRDLKPGNILVTSARIPKLLDFGIAKIVFPELDENVGVHTQGMRLMTPEYGSPEQVRGEPVSTATDIYSLGAVLYELLTGRKVHRFENRTVAEVERIVGNSPLIAPSVAAAGHRPEHPTLAPHALRGDIDRIVLKALQKDPAVRYASVDQLAEDIRRWLEGRPVLASGGKLPYRAWKFVRRNKAGVAATSVAILSLLIALGVSMWQTHVAQREREVAERRFQDVRQLANAFLIEYDTLAALPGGTAIRSALIQRSLRYLDALARESGDDATLQRELATAYEKLGDVQGLPGGPNMGDTASAMTSYRTALTIREKLAARAPADRNVRAELAGTYSRLSSVHALAGGYQAALDYDRKSLALEQALLTEDPSNREYRRLLASTYTSLGGGLSQLGRWGEVPEMRRKAVALYEELAAGSSAEASDWSGLSLAHTRLANILIRNGSPTEAMEHYRKAEESINRGMLAFPDDLRLRSRRADAANSLGRALIDMKRWNDALEKFRTAHGVYHELAIADPDDVRTRSLEALARFGIGRALLGAGRAGEAVPEFQQALASRQELARRNPLNSGARGEVAESHGGLADAYSVLGRREESLTEYRKAQQLLQALDLEGRMNSASQAELERVSKALQQQSTR